MVGWRQQAARQEAASSSAGDRSRSPVVKKLPEQVLRWYQSWGWGQKTAVDIIKDARACVVDHGGNKVHECINQLAKTIDLTNAERSVERHAPLDGVVLPTSIEDSAVRCILEPHVLFNWLATKNERLFRIHLGAQREGVEEFWTGLRQSEAGRELWRAHPWLRGKTATDLKWHLPLMLCEDAGPVSTSKSSMIRIWYSLLGQGGERTTRYMINSYLKNTEEEDQSWPLVLRSFEMLAEPKPEGIWGGILLFLGWDLDHVCNTMGFPHFNSHEPCALCLANDTTRPWNNFHHEAGWRDTELSNVAFLARLRRPLHPLTAHPLVNRQTYRHDLLHMIDMHGVAAMLLGNSFWTHVSGERRCEVLPGTNIEERLVFLNNDVEAYYKHMKISCRTPPLNKSNIKEGSSPPELKGQGVKAAVARRLIPYAVNLQQRAVSMAPTDKHQHMLRAVESLHLLIDLFYNATMFLYMEELTALEGHLARLGRHVQWLAVNAFREERTQRWQIKPKMHFVVGHILQQAKLINPPCNPGVW